MLPASSKPIMLPKRFQSLDCPARLAPRIGILKTPAACTFDEYTDCMKDRVSATQFLSPLMSASLGPSNESMLTALLAARDWRAVITAGVIGFGSVPPLKSR